MSIDLTIKEVEFLLLHLEYFSQAFELQGLDAECIPSLISKLDNLLSI